MKDYRQELLTQIGKGTLAGVVGTLAMSVVMIAGQSLTRVGKLPPKKIVESVYQKAAGQRPSDKAANRLAVLAHLGFGAGAGGAYALFARWMRCVPSVILGPLAGLTIWGLSYEGWIPAAGIMPTARRDRKDRVYTMILAHLVYGGALGFLEEKWASRKRAQRSRARSSLCDGRVPSL